MNVQQNWIWSRWRFSLNWFDKSFDTCLSRKILPRHVIAANEIFLLRCIVPSSSLLRFIFQISKCTRVRIWNQKFGVVNNVNECSRSCLWKNHKWMLSFGSSFQWKCFVMTWWFKLIRFQIPKWNGSISFVNHFQQNIFRSLSQRKD